jgi:hypothetical protein
MAPPLIGIAQMLRQGVDQFLLQAQLQLLPLIMNDEVDWPTGERYSRAWDHIEYDLGCKPRVEVLASFHANPAKPVRCAIILSTEDHATGRTSAQPHGEESPLVWG